MTALYPWIVFGGAMFGLILLSYILYVYFADPHESYGFAMITVVLSFTVSILCTLLIPVDIYIISEGVIVSKSLHVSISQEHVRAAYEMLFTALLLVAFLLVPHAYFYGEERGGDFDDRLEKANCCNAAKSTIFFVGFVMVLVVIGLNFRPEHTQTMAWDSEEHALRWLSDLLDTQHKGLNAISFAIACLTFLGVAGWVFYTAYGMAAMPFDWLRGKQSTSEQRQDLESSIAAIREKYRVIQSKYEAREDGSPDLSVMKAADRKEFNRMQREHKSLMQHNYRLQEIEQKAGLVIPKLMHFLVPFRWAIGVGMMSISLLVATSLFLTLIDRLVHSPCGVSCGFTLKERQIFNPADEIFMKLSHIFPADFIVLGILVLYIFSASVFGIVSLGIRVLCFTMYALRARKSMPQALLVLCNVMSHILLALCMALLTIAPHYTTFGSQRVLSEDGSSGLCSLDRRDTKVACQVSVISAFFNRIAVSMPFFSVCYFFANWAFIVVFATVFTRSFLSQRRTPFLDPVQEECEEEEFGLLSFTS